MYLSKLEIQGFKSFANKTVINFTKGITGIVGPNGCGKTNIVDALRWSLGEQKSSTLRSDKMENVIFNGTRQRKPMGMAEVSLTLVNDKNLLPTEYSEITITRRIFRSGESEYLLNRNVCRLKDITNLFMDTGMGTNAYSVIELKMVEVILSNKADERRRMFEEAAGVNKYKLRRRLALKKLDDVRSDLTRVNDIVSEVEKTVRSLERQAKKADRYNQIQGVLREKELELSSREFYRLSIKIEQLAKEKNQLNIRKDETDGKIRELEKELIQLREEIEQVEGRLSVKRNELGENTEEIHRNENSYSVAQERVNSLERNKERFESELVSLEEQKIKTEQTIADTEERIIQLKDEIEFKKENIEKRSGEIEEKKSGLEGKRTELRRLTDGLLDKEREINSIENRLNSKNESLSKTQKSIEKLSARIQNLTGEIAKTVGYLEELNGEKTDTESRLSKNEDILNARSAEKSNAESRLEKLKSDELEMRSRLNELTSRIDFLQSLISNLEGLSGGSKYLIENKNWASDNVKMFADLGTAEDKFKFAIDAALKRVLNNFIISNITELEKAITSLKSGNLGKAAFYIPADLNGKGGFVDKLVNYNKNRKRKKIKDVPGFISFAGDLVKTEKKWKMYFDEFLAETVVVDSLESGLKMKQSYPAFNYVTPEGDIIQKDGVVEAGSKPKADETLLGRKQKLKELESRYPEVSGALEIIRSEIEQQENIISSINIKDIEDQSKLLQGDINTLEKQISQFEFEKQKADEETQALQEEINESVSQCSVYENEIKKLQIEIENRQNTLKEQRDDAGNFELTLKELEDEYSAELNAFNQQKLELERANGQLINLNNSLRRSNENKASTLVSIEKHHSDIEQTANEREEIFSRISGVKEFLDDLKEKRNVLNEERGVIEDTLREIKGKASGYEREVNQLRNGRQDISEKLYQIDIQSNKISMNIDNLKEHIKDEYNEELQLMEYDDIEEFDFMGVKSEVTDLKDKLKNLGPINLLAYSEYEEEKERLDFLFRQRDDLVDSEKDIKATIKEINENAQEQFSTTFAQIKENFKVIFQTLFNPEDEADLTLEEGIDPLEAKIEIIAKPKGKRPTSIELLSGGEKTLTATALLFAIYLVKPSPFCVLDEVDAPLDDANIDRFTKLLKEFSNNTQFIIVTHNKRTMEAAENMYGVTMQDEGVSKIAGVQFTEDLPVD